MRPACRQAGVRLEHKNTYKYFLFSMAAEERGKVGTQTDLQWSGIVLFYEC